MEIQAIHKFPQDSINRLLASIPFYKTVRQIDQRQYETLLSHSKIIEYQPGEVLLEKGQHENWLYFLLKGQLEVHAGKNNDSTIVNYITPGEVFGDMAVLFNHVRTATVVADSNSKKILVFGTDFRIFGQLHDLSVISLATKLIYYRNMVHNLRWKLEVYRAAHPNQPFASEHRKIKLFNGNKDSMDELVSLDSQARELATLLVRWNEAIDRLTLTPRSSIDSESLRVLE